jgi:hypothetical protein
LALRTIEACAPDGDIGAHSLSHCLARNISLICSRAEGEDRDKKRSTSFGKESHSLAVGVLVLAVAVCFGFIGIVRFYSVPLFSMGMLVALILIAASFFLAQWSLIRLWI